MNVRFFTGIHGVSHTSFFNSSFRQRINGYTESVCKIDDCWLTQLCCDAFNVRDIGRLLFRHFSQNLLRPPLLLPIPPNANPNRSIIQFQYDFLIFENISEHYCISNSDMLECYRSPNRIHNNILGKEKGRQK